MITNIAKRIYREIKNAEELENQRKIYIDREEKGEVLEIKTMQNILDTTMLLILWISAFAGHKVMKKIQPEIARLYLGYAIFICILVTGFAVAYQFRG